MTQSKKPPTREEVWKMFRKIDLTPYHDDKNGLTYVPWARAWSIAMDHIGEHMTVKWHGMTNEDGTVLDYIKAPSGTASVCCSILVGGVPYSECTLAVMDYRNKPIVEPTSVDLQNSRQRCRTKALAELGLGRENRGGRKLSREWCREGYKIDPTDQRTGRISEYIRGRSWLTTG